LLFPIFCNFFPIGSDFFSFFLWFYFEFRISSFPDRFVSNLGFLISNFYCLSRGACALGGHDDPKLQRIVVWNCLPTRTL